MPTTSPCVPCCSTPQSVNIPGIEGPAGVDGLPGVNAYSILQVASIAFTNAGDPGTLTVDTSAWMVIGQVIVADGPLHFTVVSKPSATTVNVTYLKYAGDIGGALAQFSTIAPAGGGIAILSGADSLVAGTATITAPITANSVIMATFSDPDAATVGVLSIPIATRNVGAGTFVVNSVKADGTTPLNTDTGSFDWLVVG